MGTLMTREPMCWVAASEFAQNCAQFMVKQIQPVSRAGMGWLERGTLKLWVLRMMQCNGYN